MSRAMGRIETIIAEHFGPEDHGVRGGARGNEYLYQLARACDEHGLDHSLEITTRTDDIWERGVNAMGHAVYRYLRTETTAREPRETIRVGHVGRQIMGILVRAGRGEWDGSPNNRAVAALHEATGLPVVG